MDLVLWVKMSLGSFCYCLCRHLCLSLSSSKHYLLLLLAVALNSAPTVSTFENLPSPTMIPRTSSLLWAPLDQQPQSKPLVIFSFSSNLCINWVPARNASLDSSGRERSQLPKRYDWRGPKTTFGEETLFHHIWYSFFWVDHVKLQVPRCDGMLSLVIDNFIIQL